MGIEASPDEVVTSAVAAARHLLSLGVNEAAVAGEPGLIETLREHGIAGRPVKESASGALVVGIWRGVDYAGLDAALQILLAGADFVATNADPTYPMPGGRLQPGAGAIVAALQAASGRTPTIVGKPHPALIETAMASAGAGATETLVVGDRLDTDLLAGERAGCATWLVLTGVTMVPPMGQPFSADLRGLP
jgi:4-nitrophenyl phosphatase